MSTCYREISYPGFADRRSNVNALFISISLLAHASPIPHVHPNEAGIALAITLLLAMVVGALVATLNRKPVAT